LKTSPNETLGAYYLLPKYSCNLQEYLDKNNCLNKNVDFILKTASRMLEALELLHSTGLTYNDLKPQNIMVEEKKGGKV
jgi:serine/threonine protein kinase